LKILGIDTSSGFLSIAVSDDNNIIKEENHLLERKHSSLLIPKIIEMLEAQGISIGDIGAFIVGLGPGSFTGLRIGVSAIKGFGLALGRPCVGVASMDAMALNAKDKAGLIVPVIDAKRGNVYSAIYRERKGSVKRNSGYLLLKVKDLMKKIKTPAVFLGDGQALYGEEIKRYNKDVVFLGEEYWYPKASALIRLGYPGIKKFKKNDLSRLNPIYLYPRDCQVRK